MCTLKKRMYVPGILTILEDIVCTTYVKGLFNNLCRIITSQDVIVDLTLYFYCQDKIPK